MRFCVIRHPDIKTLGTCPESALDIHRGNGWFRVSDWRTGADQFHLPDYAEAVADFDAKPEPVAVEAVPTDGPSSEPEPEPTTASRKNTKEKPA